MNMSEIKLLPCAHCGHDKNELYNNADEDTEGFFWTGILCNCCRSGFSIGGISIETNQEIILRKWNRRAPQPVAVIVPPLEWIKWTTWNIYNDSFVKWSNHSEYRIFDNRKKALTYPENRYSAQCTGEGGGWVGLGEFTTEAEAIAACQAHKQTTVDKAIEGCNVVLYRDPQPLLDGLKEIKAIGREAECDSDFKDMALAHAEYTLKAWEANQ